MIKTSPDLISEIKLSASLPLNDSRFTDVRLLSLADSELQSVVIPLVMAAREEFLATSETLTLDGTTGKLQVPYRSIGSIVREVRYDGKPIPFIQASQAWQYESQCAGFPHGYTLLGDCIQILPKATAGSVEVGYYLRPSKLVKPSQCGLIASVNPISGDVVLQSALSGVTTGTAMDFVSSKSSNSVVGFDKLPTNVDGTTVSFTPSDLPQCLKVGDYLCFAEQSPVIPIIQEGFQLLAQCVVSRCLEAMLDTEGLQASLAKQNQKAATFRDLLNPRNHTTEKINHKPFARSNSLNRFNRRLY